jgi:ABC-2 type transport system ATP-binding protein
MDAIVIESLTKTFAAGWPGLPPIRALSGLTLSVARGEIFGFLGPNGAGKTTTIKILLGLIKPTGGRAELLGAPAGDVEVKRRIGFLPEAPYFYDYLTVEEFLGFYGSLGGIERAVLGKRIRELLDIVGMDHARSRQLRKLSKGMLQRIGLAQALIHNPELVILDEPMSGLDPIGRKQVRDIILHLRDQGKTVFFSSHIIPDVEMICDRVAIVIQGKLFASGRVDELVKHGHTRSVEIVCEGIQADKIATIKEIAQRIWQRGNQSLIVLEKHHHVESILDVIRRQRGTLISVIPQKGSLEELFIQDGQQTSQGEEPRSCERLAS